MIVGCLILAVLGILFPRLVIAYLFLFTTVLSTAYSNWILPLIGFLLLPWTTLAVTWGLITYGDLDGFSVLAWILVAVGVLLDSSSTKPSFSLSVRK